VLSLLCDVTGTPFPQPRGDPSKRGAAAAAAAGSTKKHALVELVEQAAPLPFPARDWRPAELKAWLDKGDLASGLGLRPLRSLHVPVYVNVYVVGLEGAGALGINLPATQLAEWMQEMEHVVPAGVLLDTRGEAEASDLEHSSSTQSRKRATDAGEDDDVSADASVVPAQSEAARLSYRYHIRLVELSPKVIQVVERYLGVHYRVENAAHTSFQIDAEVISGALEGLVKYLHLDE